MTDKILEAILRRVAQNIADAEAESSGSNTAGSDRTDDSDELFEYDWAGDDD